MKPGVCLRLSLCLLLAGVALSGSSLAQAATITVTNTNDSGPGSLRNALASASPGDTVNFSLTLPATITLASTLSINVNLTIIGPGPSNLAISGNNAVQVFSIASGITVTISGLTIQNGFGINGGGISNLGNLTLSNSVLTGNASCCGTPGGGIYNPFTLTVSDTTFSNNSSYYDGGAISDQPGATTTIIRSTFSNNVAQHGAGGGAISNFSNSFYGATLTIIDSTFWQNSAGTGGAIDNTGTLNLSSNTFSGNSAGAGLGGGVANVGGTLAVKNNIFANSTPGGNCYLPSGSINSGAHNLSDDNTCSSLLNSTGDLNSTPAGLAAAGLQSNGGPTQTIALLPTSLAVDAIPDAACTDLLGNPVFTDQRGTSRPQGSQCDIGAYEIIPALPADNDAAFANLSGGNVFAGNQTVNGALTASSFFGNAAGLTNLNPANIAPGTAGINITGNAATATTAFGVTCADCVSSTQLGVNFAAGDAKNGNALNSLMLGGLLPGAFAPASGSSAYIAKSGDTMTGRLNVPANGLAAGGTQFVLSNGFAGVGTSAPDSTLTVSNSSPVMPGWNNSMAQLHLHNSDPAWGTFLLFTAASSPAVPWSLYRYGSNGAINGGTNNPLTNQGNRLCMGVVGVSEEMCLNQQGTLGLTGGLTAAGSVSAAAFSGDGSGLTNLNASNVANGTVPTAALSGTYNVSITGNAATSTAAGLAANSTALGNVAAVNYARVDIGNNLNGTQNVNGSVNVTGSESLTGNLSVSGATSTTGPLTIGSGGTPITGHTSVLVNPTFPALGPGACRTQSFPMTGAADGDTIALGVPNARMTGGGTLLYTVWVSAADMVSVRACNLNLFAGQKTAGSGMIRVDLWKH